MSSVSNVNAFDARIETDSLGEVAVPSEKLWGAQTQRSLQHFSIGHDLLPREMISAYAIVKKAAANANHAAGRLKDVQHRLIVQVCDEIQAGHHKDMFPLHVWMTGSGTQFNMNVNEVISNRCCQLAGTPPGSKTPVHPNDDVNMCQSSNNSFPTAMNLAAAINVKQRLVPAVKALRIALSAVIGYDKASEIAHYALDHDLTPKQAALKLGFVTEDEFDRVVDPAKMVRPYVAGASSTTPHLARQQHTSH